MSILNKLIKYYSLIPIPVLNMVGCCVNLIPAKIRYGKVFSATYDQLCKLDSENNSKEKEIDLLIKKTVNNAYQNVPYYRNLAQAKGINIDDIKSSDDLVKLPIITKEDIKENSDLMISDCYAKKDLLYVKTSGSTGAPVGFYQDKDIIMKEWAYVNYIWKRAGYKPGSSRLVMRGKVFRAMKQGKGNWQWDALRQELSINIFDMTEKNMAIYSKAIEKYKPDFIHGYPSAIRIFCTYVEKHPLQHHFKGVLAVSEKLIDDDRSYIERTLCTRVFSFYGHSERLVIAGECEYSHEYHIEPLYGYAEIVDSEGNRISASDVEGELVATGFLNNSMPLIRYKTGDIASWSAKDECPCGRKHLRINSIEGRWGRDLLVSSRGAQISMAALNMHSNVFDHVRIFQYVQNERGKVEFRYVPTLDFSVDDKSELLIQLEEKFGKDFQVSLVQVDSIPVGKNGKHKLIIQNMN